VPYTITLTNVLGGVVQGVTLIDRFPAGFRYVKGSARIDNTPAEPAVNGLQLTWSNLSFGGGGHHSIVLLLAVGAGVGEGEFVNRAQAFAGVGGNPISGVATATVRVVPDPTFDCTDVIGKVFDDANRNGEQDKGERGLANVRVVTAIMIVMIATAGLTMLLFKASPAKALSGNMMSSGISAVICIVGVAWLGSSFFEGNRTFIVGGISGIVEGHPWTFAIGLFALSSMLFSAAATVTILMPVGVALGLPATSLIAFYPAANGVFFLPTYGTLLAAVSFDQTGTTKIGKYLLNHSFMRPGLVAVATSIGIGVLLEKLLAR